MKTIKYLLALMFFAAFGLCHAAEVQLGTWKLVEAKSKLHPLATKITRAVYAPEGDMVKIITDGIDRNGRRTHDEWLGKLDGEDYPVTGDPNSDMRAYKKLDEYTLELTVKKAGNVITHAYVVIAADGKSRVTLAVVPDANGQRVPFIGVYDKQ